MTTFQKAATLFVSGALLTLLLFASFFLGRKTAPKCPQIPPADTTFVADTSHHEEPEPAEVIPAGYELIKVGTVAQLRKTIAALEAAAAAAAQDTTHAPLPDTASVVVPLPVERKIYEDTTYRAVISGINPVLESIDVYSKTAYITQTVYQPVEYDERLYAVADVGADHFYRYVRAGLTFERRITGPLYYELSGGYEWTSLGNGGYMKAGLILDLRRK